MAEHLIRLRGAWELEPEEPGRGPPRRVALPTDRTHLPAAPFRLIRRFNRPPIDAGRERVSLRLEGVAGLVSAGINGREVARPPPGTAVLDLEIEADLRPKNVLVLQIDPATLAEGVWGAIALVIAPR